MSQASRHAVTLVTDGSGAATGYTDTVTGRVLTARYVKTDFTDGVVFTITSEATGETIWTQTAVNASVTVAPRQPTHTTAGVASLYAAAGVAVNDYVGLATDRIKVAISSGGSTHTGTFYFLIG